MPVGRCKAGQPENQRRQRSDEQQGFETLGALYRGAAQCESVNSEGIMLHARRPVATAQDCAAYSPLSVSARGGEYTARIPMWRFGWQSWMAEYAAPAVHARRKVTVEGYVDRAEIAPGAGIVARHRRSHVYRPRFVCDPAMAFRGVSCVWFACVLCAVSGGAAAGAEAPAGGALSLTLGEAIALALGNSRAAIAARLDREEQKLSLESAEERYDPMASLSVSANARSQGDETAVVSIGPSLRVPTGGSFRLSLRKPLAGERDRATSTGLTFSQPLLKGFGTDIDTAPLRRARLQEHINLRGFRDTVSGIVDSVISAYRGRLSAGRRVAIAREALERARRQLEINRALVEAGRMAPQDLVQTEAEVANREYDLTDSENALDTANSTLANVLDLEEGARLEPQEEPPVEPERPDLEESLATAFARRTDWLRAEIGLEFARIGLRTARNNRLPDLSLNASASHSSGRDRTDWVGGLNLTVPLQDDEPRRALTRARNNLRRAEMERAERRQSIRIEARRAVHDVAVALRQIDLARQGRELAERKLDVERRKLQQGLSSAFQLGRFEDDLVAAQRREVDAVVGYRNVLTGLDRTLGTTLDRWGIGIELVGR